MDIYVLDNKKLDFKDSRNEVLSFIQKRCDSYGHDFKMLVPDVDTMSKYVGQGQDIALINIMSPFFDNSFLDWNRGRFETDKVTSIGMVPGTSPVAIWGSKASFESAEERPVRWETQVKYTNQFDLNKYKRLRVFLELNDAIECMHSLDTGKLIQMLEENDKLFELVASYTVGGELTYYDKCPHCGGDHQAIPANSCQSMIGFLPVSRPLYFECQSCKLVYISPRVSDEKIPELYDEFDYEDFRQSFNNPYSPASPRANMSAVLETFGDDVSCLDLGGGVGKYSELIKSNYPNWNVTHSDFSLKIGHEHLNKLGVETRTVNFLEEEIGENQYNLITMWEVIEHIPYEKLSDVFANIKKALKPGGYFIFSTPDFSSPYCSIGDFFNVASPFHLTCFTREWMTEYVDGLGGWKSEGFRANSDLVEDWGGWLGHMAKNSPGPANRAIFEAINEATKLKEPALDHVLKTHGSEFIMTLRKDS